MINLNKTKIFQNPFPILVVENFFEDNFLDLLLKEFPKNEEFIFFKKTMVNRRFLSNDNPDFYNYINKNKNWSKFYKLINSSDFYKKILNLLLVDKNFFNKITEVPFHKNLYKKDKFNFNLSYYLREMTQQMPRNRLVNYLRKYTKKIINKNNKNKNHIYLRFDISSASNGYHREPHTDSDGTIFAFLVYLEDQKNIGGSGGELIIHDKDLKISKIFTPKKNKAIFFLSNQSSYHSVSKIIDAKGRRNFIYGGYSSVNKNIWSN